MRVLSEEGALNGAGTTCALSRTHCHRLRCAQECAKRDPVTIIRQPTPTKFPIENGPEIVNFRPVL